MTDKRSGSAKHRSPDGPSPADAIHRDRQQKEAYVRSMFNAIAGGYDWMNRLMTGGLLFYWHRVFARETGLQPGDRALDVACGTGDLTQIMARQVGDSGKLVAVDLAEGMLARGRQRFEAGQRGQRIGFIHANALQLPLKSNLFDCVGSGFLLRNVADLPRALVEMKRVARPGGRVVSLEISHPTHSLLARPFWFYFERVVPALGSWARRVFPDGPIAPYQWLPESLKAFPDQEQLASIFRSAGLERVRYRNLNGGVVAVHVGIKPE